MNSRLFFYSELINLLMQMFRKKLSIDMLINKFIF